MNKPVILIVEENQALRERMKEYLVCQGLDVIEARDQITAITSWRCRVPKLAVIGSAVDGRWDGLDLAKQIRAKDNTIPLILIAHQSSEASAIAALRLGVNDYFKWPFHYDELLDSIKKNLSGPCDTSGNAQTRPDERCTDHVLVGDSPVMRRIKAYLPKVAVTDSMVLITGETGTGKECVARLIHQNSPRRDKPLVCINCAALPDTLIESELFGYERGAFTGANSSYEGKLTLAEGGSLFLDEIGDMSLYAQAKILRVIENKEITPLRGKTSTNVDIRIIAATNQDLQQLISDGRFRKDLYYRLNVARVHLPSLQERKDDIQLLTEHYLKRFATTRLEERIEGFTNEAYQCLIAYDWPGNVRELKNAIEHLIIEHSSPCITPRDLPETIRQSDCLDKGKPQVERELLLSNLLSTNWNKSKTAQNLNWSRMTVYRKIAKYHLHQSQPERSKAIDTVTV